jgi:hypothetical protein
MSICKRDTSVNQRWNQFVERIGGAPVSEYKIDFDEYSLLWGITPRAVRNQINEWLEEGRITLSPDKPRGRGNPCYISYEGSWKLEVGSVPLRGNTTSNFQLPTSQRQILPSSQWKRIAAKHNRAEVDEETVKRVIEQACQEHFEALKESGCNEIQAALATVKYEKKCQNDKGYRTTLVKNYTTGRDLENTMDSHP